MSETAEQPGAEALQGELARLRARNEELEAAHRATPAQRTARVARSTGSAILVVVGVLCLVLAPVAVWGRNLLLNTDRYVETLRPIASNPGMQDAVIRAVDNQVNAHLDVKSLLTDVLPPRAAQVLAGPLQSAASGLVNTVTTRFVESDAFETLWVGINRAAHQQIVYVLTGSRPANAALHTTSQGTIVLDLSKVVDNVKARLVSAGISVAAKVPTVGTVIEIGQLKGLDKARKATRAVNTIADWLPWIGIVLATGGIVAARKRRRALTRAALGLGAGMIVIGIVLLVLRHLYLDQVPTDKLPRETAQYLFDTVVRFLRLGIRLVFLLALLVAFGAWVSGPTRAAVGTRRAVTSTAQRIGTGLPTGRLGAFVARHAMAFRIGVIALAGIVLVVSDSLSLAGVITLAVVVVVLLLVVEMLRASGHQAAT